MSKPTECIPFGLYCYTIVKVDSTTGKLAVQYCPYFGHYSDGAGGKGAYCAFCEDIDAILLDDSCKICGENDDYTEEDFF